MMQFQGQHYRRHLWRGWQVKMNGKRMRAVTVFNVHLPSLRSVDSATICWLMKKSQGIYFSGSIYIIFQLPLIMRTVLISGHSLPSASTELSVRLTFVSWCISDSRREEEWQKDSTKFILNPNNISQSKARFQYFAKKKKKKINAISSSLF